MEENKSVVVEKQIGLTKEISPYENPCWPP